MNYDLDMDLLEFCDVSNYFNDRNIADNIMTENMIFEVYENQRFLIEQDNIIFESLQYGIVTEGVVSKIVDAIRSLFRKIKDLIIKFINFLKSKFGKNKGNGSSNSNQDSDKKEVKSVEDAKKVMKQADEVVKQAKATVEIKKKEIARLSVSQGNSNTAVSVRGNSSSNKYLSLPDGKSNGNSNYEYQSEKISKLEQMIAELEEEKNKNNFKPIIIGKEAKETAADMTKGTIGPIDKRNSFLNTIKMMVNTLKNYANDDTVLKNADTDLTDTVNELNALKDNTVKAAASIRIGSECNFNEYSSYLKENEDFFNLFENNYNKYISFFQNCLDSEIKPAESFINKIELIDTDDPRVNKINQLLKKISNIVSLEYSLVNASINFMVNAESCNGMHKRNMKKINSIKQKSDAIRKMQESL